MTTILCPQCGGKLPLGDFTYNFTGVRFDTGCRNCDIPVYWERTYEQMALDNAPTTEPMVKLISAPTFTPEDVVILKKMHIAFPTEEAA